MSKSHDRFALGLNALWFKIHLTPRIKVEFQATIPFHMFAHWTTEAKKKISVASRFLRQLYVFHTVFLFSFLLFLSRLPSGRSEHEGEPGVDLAWMPEDILRVKLQKLHFIEML